MDWSRYQAMDPHLLVGVVNTELRNHSESLEDLCRNHDITQAELIAYLAQAGYDYLPAQKKFR